MYTLGEREKEKNVIICIWENVLRFSYVITHIFITFTEKINKFINSPYAEM